MSKQDGVLAGLTMELRRGTIVLSVLSQLKKPMYGYHLVTQLDQQGITVETNTLYPLLRRLENQGLLESSWDTSESKPRKYYVRTSLGTDVYKALKQQWMDTARHMELLLGE